MNNDDPTDTIHIDVPTFIRLLELSREDVKSDMPLHFIAEKAVELSKDGIITMDNYEEIIANARIDSKENQINELRRLSGL